MKLSFTPYRIIFVIVLLFSWSALQAQDLFFEENDFLLIGKKQDEKKEFDWQDKKNTLKFTFPAVGFERVLSKKKSVNFHLFYWKFTDEPSVTLMLDDVPIDDQAFVSAFALTGEYRFYKGRKPAPNGFYIAPYLRYSRLKGNITDTGLDDGFDDDLPGLMEMQVTMVGGGVQFGVQWNIKNVVTIDWGLLGVGGNLATFDLTIRSDQPNTNYERVAENLNTEIEDAPGLWGVILNGVEFEAEGESVVSSHTKALPAIRSNLTIGIRF